ncbi:MAG: protein kinase [Peptococcaceae bacterium]|nr:protein kinase [Peptococcaceae bacterium]
MVDQKGFLWSGSQVESIIGQGAFGKVYKIRLEEEGEIHYAAVRVVNIPQSSELQKMRNDGLSDDAIRDHCQALVNNIISEIEQMAAFRENKHIVSIDDHQIVEKTDGIGWYILIRMEYLESLSEHMEEPRAYDEIIKLGIHICRALESTVPQNIIHRDIKPNNIFLSPNGDYKLGDLGIAQKTGNGTDNYMAPEIFRGEKRDAAGDIYALGVLMYQLLNGNRLPFLADFPLPITPCDNENALKRRLSGEAFPGLKGGHPELNAIVLKACAHERDERFANPAEMREALESIRMDCPRPESRGAAEAEVPPPADVSHQTDKPGRRAKAPHLTTSAAIMTSGAAEMPTGATEPIDTKSSIVVGAPSANQPGSSKNLLIVGVALSALGILLFTLAIVMIINVFPLKQKSASFQDQQSQDVNGSGVSQNEQDIGDDDKTDGSEQPAIDADPNSLAIVTYNCVENGGTTPTKARKAEIGKPVDLALQAAKDGWEFLGWNTNQSATVGLTAYTMPKTNVTLYAIYKKTLTATFHDYKGADPVSRSVSVTIYNKAAGGNIAVPALNTYTGWTSRGWSMSQEPDAGITVSPGSRTISADTTYYGLYQRTLSLSYDFNGKKCTVPPSRTGTQYANSYDISNPLNPSFSVGAVSNNTVEFLHWSLNIVANKEYTPGSVITISSDSKLYAVWKDG